MTTVRKEMGRYDGAVVFSKAGAGVLQTSKAKLMFSKAKAVSCRGRYGP